MDKPHITKDDPAVRQCEAMLRFIHSAPDAETEKNRRALVRKIIKNWNDPDATPEIIPPTIANPDAPPVFKAVERNLFEFAAGRADVIIGQYMAKPNDTPESRERSLREFLEKCRELAPHAEVIVLMPSANGAEKIDEAALDAAVRIYATVSRDNRAEEARRERIRARSESGVGE